MNYLYRFRSAEALLGSHQELKKQQIYFSNLDRLNDPMEGFQEIIWKGDSVTWSRFLNHYIRCLISIFCENIIRDLQPNLGDFTYENLKNDQYKISERVSQEFFNNIIVSLYLHALARCGKVPKRILIIALTSLHRLILEYTNQIFIRDFGITLLESSPSASTQMNILVDLGFLTIIAESLNTIAEEKSEQLLVSIERETLVPANVNHEIGISHWIVKTFPSKFLELLGNTIRPKHFLACFSEDYTNPAMWGHYAKGNTGICLKFKVGDSKTDRQIKLTDMDNLETKSHYFHKVQYQVERPEVDILMFLGFSPNDDSNLHLDKHSSLFKEKGWSDEQEWRLILELPLSHEIEGTGYVLKYNLVDLDSIIFGTKISPKHKQQIIEIVTEQCTAQGINTPKFYQARHSKTRGNIQVVEYRDYTLADLEHGGTQ